MGDTVKQTPANKIWGTRAVKKFSILLPASIAIILGILAAYLDIGLLNKSAATIAELFMRLVKLISIPIILLAIISTLLRLESPDKIKHLGIMVFKYTIFTTLISAAIGLALFQWLNPVQTVPLQTIQPALTEASYTTAIMNMIPDNIFNAFSEGNVLGVIMIAVAFAISALYLPAPQRAVLHTTFDAFFQVFLNLAKAVIFVLPVAIFAFTVLFIQEVRGENETFQIVAKFFIVVLLANFIQGLIVLPLLLKFKGISPLQVFRIMLPALITAFFSKSSIGTLPTTLECINKHPTMSKKISSFSLPLCSVINMNGCAAFIIITVLFVSMSAGVHFHSYEMIAWVGLATIAAIGNAAVPMGCYFLATSFLLAMKVPITMMGYILPVYVFIDMVETALNVWSDCVVTSIVNKEAQGDEEIGSGLSLNP